MNSEELKARIGQALYAAEEARQLSGYYQKLTIPGIPKGKQTLKTFDFRKGETVTSNGTGPFKEGVKGIVKERYKQNGYWYFVTDTMGVMRQKDICPKGV